jgi:hypothetical protein
MAESVLWSAALSVEESRLNEMFVPVPVDVVAGWQPNPAGGGVVSQTR